MLIRTIAERFKTEPEILYESTLSYETWRVELEAASIVADEAAKTMLSGAIRVQTWNGQEWQDQYRAWG
jgi:hypothetical protein